MERVYVLSKWGNSSHHRQSEAAPQGILQLNPSVPRNFCLNGSKGFHEVFYSHPSSNICAPSILCPSKSAIFTMVQNTVKLGSGHEMPLDGFGLWKVPKENAADTVYNVSLLVLLIDLTQIIVGYQSGLQTLRRRLRLPKRKRSWRRHSPRHQRRPRKA